MTITNYATLKTAVADWLNRDDLTSVIPSFIALAEADINRALRDYRMEKRSTALVDTQYSALPADWMETIRIQISGDPSRIELVSDAAISDMRYSRSDRAGKPTHYAHTAGGLELFPTPDDEYTIEIVYYGRVPALSDDATTNWLLTAAPDVYLYGALTQSAPYLKDDQRAGVWGALYQNAIASLNSASEQTRHSGTGLRLRIRGM